MRSFDVQDFCRPRDGDALADYYIEERSYFSGTDCLAQTFSGVRKRSQVESIARSSLRSRCAMSSCQSACGYRADIVALIARISASTIRCGGDNPAAT